VLDLGPASDCADVEAIREELARLMDRVQTLLAQSQRFAADAAHELRTPLTALRTELELHAEDLVGEDRRVLERACERVARLSDLIERLLVLALPPEHLRQGFTAVSLAELADEVVADLPEPERQRVRLELECEGLVRGDNELLRALIANALQNALKFAAQGPVTLQLTHHRAGEQQLVRLLVKDTGPGVPSGLRQRVFEPFYRGVPNATPGHGIGLALMGHIASAHSGRAEFLDTSEGACLAVSLPGWSARNLPRAPITPASETDSGT
jgi:signal transduction histidine kinase